MKTLFLIAAIAGGLAAVPAEAQTVSDGHTMVVGGAGAKAAHSDSVTVGVDDRNLNIGASVADGVRIGDSKIQAGANATISVPVPTPSHPVPVPTPEQATAPLVAPVVAPIQAVRRLFKL